MDVIGIKASVKRTFKTFGGALPILIGVLMLISILNPLFSANYPDLFIGHYLLDPLIGAIGGSIAFGIPITAYVAGGELLAEGVSLLAISAFMTAWTTVGVAMLPLEAKFLGLRFALIRNAMNFVFSIMIAILTILTLGAL